MGNRHRFHDHLDPEYQRWGQRHPRFPGVAECVRVIRAGKARGALADIIAFELAENAAACLAELIEAFRSDSTGDVRLYVMMALEVTRVPASVPFLAEVLRGGDARYAAYAGRALRGIDTRESRTVLWEVAQDETGGATNGGQ